MQKNKIIIYMNLFVLLVRILHFLIVLGIVLSVFIYSCKWKKIALLFLLFLLLQYLLGFEKCGLTTVEYVILGEEKYQKGFMYRIVNPIIRVPENYFNNGLLFVHVLWIAILLYQLNSMDCTFNLIGN